MDVRCLRSCLSTGSEADTQAGCCLPTASANSLGRQASHWKQCSCHLRGPLRLFTFTAGRLQGDCLAHFTIRETEAQGDYRAISNQMEMSSRASPRPQVSCLPVLAHVTSTLTPYGRISQI